MLRRSGSSDRRLWLAGLTLGALALVAAGARGQETATATKAKETATTKPVPKDGAWMKRHESFLERAAGGDVDLLFLGDSITQGWGGAKGVWERYYGPRKAANFGIGGDRTQHVLWRVENGELDGIKPKVVVLMIGTNNARDDSADQIAEGIEAIVKDLREKLPRARILLLGVFPRGEKPDANPAREKLAAVNERIKKLDDGGKTVKYLDIGGRFLDEDGTISREIMPDFLHLSGKGYRIWADAMEPTLWSLLDEPRAD
jgi:lysophospholipase L1-like esterase